MLTRVALWPLLAYLEPHMHISHLTYAERERAAYCAGHTRAADLLGALADNETTQDGAEHARGYIDEAMGLYPAEDALQPHIAAVRALAAKLRGGNRAALLAIVADLEQTQSDLMHAGEYGRDELRKAMGYMV